MSRKNFETTAVLTILGIILFLSGCTSIKTLISKQKLTKYNDSMFWKIEGKDSEGNPSQVYILATIPMGNNQLYPVPEEVMDAWNSATRIAGEIPSEDYPLFKRQLAEKVEEGILPETDEFRHNGKSLIDELSDEELDLSISLFGLSPTATLSYYQPWVMNLAVDNSPLVYSKNYYIPVHSYDFTFTGSNYENQETLSLLFTEKSSDFENDIMSPNKSYDYYFMKEAVSKGLTVEGLETLAEQLDYLSYGDWNFQLLLLKSKLKNIQQEKSDFDALYEAYLNADEEALSKCFFEDFDLNISMYPEYENYYNEMLYNRNKIWAEKIKNYLLQGGSTFIFADCIHFVGENSVFSYLKLK